MDRSDVEPTARESESHLREALGREFDLRFIQLAEVFRQASAETHGVVARQASELEALRHELAEARRQMADREAALERLSAQVQAREGELRAVYASASWRITSLLRLGRTAPRKLREAGAGLRKRAVTLVATVARPARRAVIPWVVRRPKLVACLRRVLSANPRLHKLVRRLAASRPLEGVRTVGISEADSVVSPRAARVLSDLRAVISPQSHQGEKSTGLRSNPLQDDSRAERTYPTPADSRPSRFPKARRQL